LNDKVGVGRDEKLVNKKRVRNKKSKNLLHDKVSVGGNEVKPVVQDACVCVHISVHIGIHISVHIGRE
jgi:hypothetical protein